MYLEGYLPIKQNRRRDERNNNDNYTHVISNFVLLYILLGSWEFFYNNTFVTYKCYTQFSYQTYILSVFPLLYSIAKSKHGTCRKYK